MVRTRAAIYVDGMTCPACETRISKSLLGLRGVTEVRAQVRGGKVDVEYDASLTDLGIIKRMIEKDGYAIREKKNSGTIMAIGLGVVLAALYLLASSIGLFTVLPKVDASIGYAMLFVVGMLISIHCVAMCGGIALSQSIPRHDGAAVGIQNRLRRLTPGLLYNGGRVLSYTVIGGIVGALGAAFSFSPVLRGTITALAGLFMVILSLRMLGLLRAVPSFTRLVPVRLRAVGTKAAFAFRSRGPLAVGFLNGFMPCGPLQTMQLYALGTGSALAGAASMFIFSVGTVPLMLVFGLTAALLPRKFVPVMVKASAILVLFLGVVTFDRAAVLSGIPLPEFSSRPSVSGGTAQSAPANLAGGALASQARLAAVVANGVQSITTEFKDGYYVPFTVQAGIPLKWTIRVKEEELNGCNNPVEVPGYHIRRVLVPGDNVIEFTPTKEGIIPYSCWMGMITSRITVVKDLAAISSGTGNDGSALSDLLGSGGSVGSGGSYCSGTNNPALAVGSNQFDTIGMPTVRDDIQEITITVGSDGYSPSVIVLQKGMRAVIKFKAKAITSCNSPVVFPEYNGVLDLAKGQLETPPILVTGDFTFQCWMDMLQGYVKAVDDLSKVDIKKVRAEIQNYRVGGGSDGSVGNSSGYNGNALSADKR